MSKEDKEFINPIDKDKITETPSLLPYAHNVGSAVIKPIDKGRTKGLAVAAMHEQSNMQLDQIRKQVELLMEQAQSIHDRVEISEAIYLADMNFEPLIGRFYHLYERKNGERVLSMIAPDEWGRSQPFQFIATVKLLSDRTWEVMEKATSNSENS